MKNDTLLQLKQDTLDACQGVHDAIWDGREHILDIETSVKHTEALMQEAKDHRNETLYTQLNRTKEDAALQAKMLRATDENKSKEVSAARAKVRECSKEFVTRYNADFDAKLEKFEAAKNACWGILAEIIELQNELLPIREAVWNAMGYYPGTLEFNQGHPTDPMKNVKLFSDGKEAVRYLAKSAGYMYWAHSVLVDHAYKKKEPDSHRQRGIFDTLIGSSYER